MAHVDYEFDSSNQVMTWWPSGTQTNQSWVQCCCLGIPGARYVTFESTNKWTFVQMMYRWCDTYLRLFNVNLTGLNKQINVYYIIYNEWKYKSVCMFHTFHCVFELYVHPSVSSLMSLVNLYQSVLNNTYYYLILTFRRI